MKDDDKYRGTKAPNGNQPSIAAFDLAHPLCHVVLKMNTSRLNGGFMWS